MGNGEEEKTMSIVPPGRIMHAIMSVRGLTVMLDADLAELYGVKTKALVQAVKRNMARFPEDFMFQLTRSEFENLRSQSVTSSWGGRRYPPYAFTEQGIAMLSSVLSSDRAVLVNIAIMRIFVQLRRNLNSHTELSGKLVDLEQRFDAQFKVVFRAIRQLMEHGDKKRRQAIGFIPEKD